MKALVYHGSGQKNWEQMPDPSILKDTDAIVRIDHSTICGTDLHILKGHVPTTAPGRIIGHEATGTVIEVGRGVAAVKKGDRVICSCVSSCGRCRFCRAGNPSQCTDEEGSWALGNTVDGLQAEFARIPFADNSLNKIPDELTDEQVIYLSDILATGYEVGVMRGQVQPGDVVVIVGTGPIGLSTMLAARLFSPALLIGVDPAASRREFALKYADLAVAPEDAAAAVADATDGLGADVAIEAVGVPQSFEQCCELIRPGGRVANIGVHGEPAHLHLETLWAKQITITTGIPDCRAIPTLIKAIASGRMDPSAFTTHRYGLDDTMEAYDTFERSAETNAMKVLLKN
jgi:alcohol dehydrogenase